MAVAGLVLDRPQVNDRRSRRTGARNAAKSFFMMLRYEPDDSQVLHQRQAWRVGNMMVLLSRKKKGSCDTI